MGKGKGKKGKAEANGGDGDDDEGPLVMEIDGDDGPGGKQKDIGAIRKEVASMLGELGLPAAAGLTSDGFDDRDFRPPQKKEQKRDSADKKTAADKKRRENPSSGTNLYRPVAAPHRRVPQACDSRRLHTHGPVSLRCPQACGGLGAAREGCQAGEGGRRA